MSGGTRTVHFPPKLPNTMRLGSGVDPMEHGSPEPANRPDILVLGSMRAALLQLNRELKDIEWSGEGYQTALRIICTQANALADGATALLRTVAERES